MSETFSSSIATDSGDEVDREVLTGTIFRRIAQSKNVDEVSALREQVVAINMCVAASLARRYFGRGESDNDLTQVAYLGLIKAVAGFDPDRENNFLSYAVPTITGELKRHFRDRCWVVRPPRRIQDLQRVITAVSDSMSQEQHRRPTVTELAERLEVPAEQVSEAMATAGCFTPASLDVSIRDESMTVLGAMIPDENRDFDRIEATMMLGPALDALSDEDREVLVLRFAEEWTQEQIARRFGTSQMQISRRLSRLMQHLQNLLEEPASAA